MMVAVCSEEMEPRTKFGDQMMLNQGSCPAAAGLPWKDAEKVTEVK
jgi:hypothetical protein